MENLTKLEVLSKIENGGHKFAWINTFSDLRLVELSEANKFKDNYLENLIEAKIFNKDMELSIMPSDSEEEFSVAEFNGKDKDYVEEKQVLYRNKSPFNNKDDKLVIRNYIDYDDNGQAFIYYSKLSDVERGECNGK